MLHGQTPQNAVKRMFLLMFSLTYSIKQHLKAKEQKSEYCYTAKIQTLLSLDKRKQSAHVRKHVC